MFPVINHITDVLPVIDGSKEFIVGTREWGSFIDYTFTHNETFDHPIKLECRGIKFDKSGAILARPLHKFFNYHEVKDVDWSVPYVVETKMDGSMVHSVKVDGTIMLMTRAGITDQSKAATKFLTTYRPDTLQMCQLLAAIGKTVIFEYVAPDNQIVVRYDKPELHLLAIRDNVTGEYDPLYMSLLSRRFERNVINEARNLTGEEGVVVKFTNGQWIKVKSDKYVMLHRARSDIVCEKNVLKVVLENKVDDLLQILPEKDADRLREYSRGVWKNIADAVQQIQQVYISIWNADRKEFAAKAVTYPELRSFLFGMFDNKTCVNLVRDFVLKKCGSESDIESIRHLIGVKW